MRAIKPLLMILGAIAGSAYVAATPPIGNGPIDAQKIDEAMRYFFCTGLGTAFGYVFGGAIVTMAKRKRTHSDQLRSPETP